MAKKCKDNKHNWTVWELQWNSKEGKIWERYCMNCPAVEKNLYTPPPEEKAGIIQWLEVQMSK